MSIRSLSAHHQSDSAPEPKSLHGCGNENSVRHRSFPDASRPASGHSRFIHNATDPSSGSTFPAIAYCSTLFAFAVRRTACPSTPGAYSSPRAICGHAFPFATAATGEPSNGTRNISPAAFVASTALGGLKSNRQLRRPRGAASPLT